MYRKAYKEHLQKFNELLKDAIDQRISNKGSRDLVLVVISDHGPGSEFKLNDIATGNYRERLSNLCAIYSSNNDVTGFYPEMTPINLMRILLNKYFLKEPLPLVKDHSFVSTWNDPFCFKEYIPEKE